MGALSVPLKFIREMEHVVSLIPLLVMQCCSHDKMVSARFLYGRSVFYIQLTECFFMAF